MFGVYLKKRTAKLALASQLQKFGENEIMMKLCTDWCVGLSCGGRRGVVVTAKLLYAGSG